VSLTILVPLLGIVVALVSTGAVQRHLSPPAATRALTAVAVGSALGVTWGLTLVVFASIAAIPALTSLAGWCRVSYPDHHGAPLWMGLAAAGTTTVGLVRAVSTIRAHRLLDRRWRSDCPVEIIASHNPMAFAVPGRPGTVVVSTGMLAALDQDERDAMLAHEHAHLAHHHHRYVRCTEVAAAIIPLLHPIVTRVRFATERWADEDATAWVPNRRVVATAVARAALASSPSRSMAMGGVGVQARVEALLVPRPLASWLTKSALSVSAIAVFAGLLSATVQLHHLITFADHVCTLR
jgi:Zn-dependent protease with chaperone function